MFIGRLWATWSSLEWSLKKKPVTGKQKLEVVVVVAAIIIKVVVVVVVVI